MRGDHIKRGQHSFRDLVLYEMQPIIRHGVVVLSLAGAFLALASLIGLFERVIPEQEAVFKFLHQIDTWLVTSLFSLFAVYSVAIVLMRMWRELDRLRRFESNIAISTAAELSSLRYAVASDATPPDVRLNRYLPVRILTDGDEIAEAEVEAATVRLLAAVGFAPYEPMYPIPRVPVGVLSARHEISGANS